MKIHILYLILLLAAAFMFNSCSQEDEQSNDGINNKEITLLNETQVSNFIFVLPEILDFSSKYQSRLTEDEKNSPGANIKFFKSLKESSKIKESGLSNHFKTTDELIIVYKNTVLAYTSIKRELTNYNTDIANLKNKIFEFRSNYTRQLENKNLSKDEYRQIKTALEGLESDEIRYSNILIVKKFEPDLDKAEQSYEQ